MYSLFLPYIYLFLVTAQNPLVDGITSAAAVTAPYDFTLGGRDWTGMCQTGQNQSPIDISTSDTTPVSDPDFSSISVDFPTQVMTEVDFQQKYPLFMANSTLNAVIDGEEIEVLLLELHMHIPAEHLVDGIRYPLELHLVYIPTTPTPSFLEFTLALLFRHGPSSPFFTSLLTNSTVDFSALIPGEIEDYVYYSGSRDVPLPDCVEPESYVIPNEVYTVSAEQIEELSRGPVLNATQASGAHGVYRDVQPLNDRTVYHRVQDLDRDNSFLIG